MCIRDRGVIKSQIAITLFRQEVQFEKQDSAAKLFVALAASDSDSHVEACLLYTSRCV